MLVGYARVSTRDQSPALQLDALREAGCERVFTEKASGAARDRPELKAALDYIRAGDIFQVVLAQRFTSPFTLPPIALYRALRRINPSPFLYYLDLPGFALIGSSPEILVRARDGEVTIRPIAGTRPRGQTIERPPSPGSGSVS